jgi:hypothetical protein
LCQANWGREEFLPTLPEGYNQVGGRISNDAGQRSSAVASASRSEATVDWRPSAKGYRRPMRTLSSQLAPIAHGLSGRPRVYADANVPAGLVGFMRLQLAWDVLSVIEHADLRRLSDTAHYRLAQQLSRTLVTLDKDYLDDARFPPGETSGVLIVSAPDETGLARLLARLDRGLFSRHEPAPDQDPLGVGREPLPLLGRKLHAHPDWTARP